MFLIFLLSSEALLLSMHELPKVEDLALEKTLKIVDDELNGDKGILRTPPRILVLRDFSPHLFVARSLFSRGLILVSQVLVSSMTEVEMKELLAVSIRRAQMKKTIWISFLSALLAALLRVVGGAWPRLWIELRNDAVPAPQDRSKHGVARFLMFLAFLPVLQGLYRMLARHSWIEPQSQAGAMRKIRVWSRYHSSQPVVGAFALYLSPGRRTG